MNSQAALVWTGKPNACNNGIARFNDEPDRLIAAAAYLTAKGVMTYQD